MSEANAPTCPFCNAPWTAAMLEQLEQHSAGCACCAGGQRAVASAGALPTKDLCCDSCGKPIYRAPAAARTNLPGLA